MTFEEAIEKAEYLRALSQVESYLSAKGAKDRAEFAAFLDRRAARAREQEEQS